MKHYVIDKVEQRLEYLIKFGIEDNLDINNMIMSKNLILDFFRKMSFREYPFGIGLNDNGYFTFEFSNNDFEVIIIFGDKVHCTFYKNNIKLISIETKDLFNDKNFNRFIKDCIKEN